MATVRRRSKTRARRSRMEGRHAPKRRPPIVQLRESTVVYPGGHVGLDRVSLSIDRGEFVFLVGPTGCGKSTFFKLLIRELEPASGQVLVAGKDIDDLSRKQVPHLRRRIGTVFQDFKLLPNRTVYDNVGYALQVTGTPRSEIKRQVPAVLRMVGLASKIHNYPDEPTGNLDPETSIGIMQLLYRINRTGTTIVVVTHDREMVDKMRRRVIQLHEGRVIRDQAAGMYATDESTTEFGARVRSEMGVEGKGRPSGSD